MGYDENAAYARRMFPYAKRASLGTGLLISVILAQWAHETGFGTSAVALNANNHGGIKYSEGNSIADGKYGAYASYGSLDQFVQDYIRVINLSYYKSVRAAKTPESQIAEFGKSPYAEDTAYASLVLGIFSAYGLRGYDTWAGEGGNGSSGSGAGNTMSGIVDTLKNQVGEMNADDVKKYAIIGLAAALVFGLLSD